MVLGTTAALAGSTALAAYLDAKWAVRRDLRGLWLAATTERDFARATKANRHSLWFAFVDQVNSLPATHQCIWSRTGTYTWQEAYAQCCRYASFFQELGVGHGDFIAFYLQNSPEFMFSMLGSWAIGSAPAMINYNLGGDGLLHCLRTSGAKVVLVDEDAEVAKRVQDQSTRIEEELGIKIVVLNKEMKARISASDVKVPDDKLAESIKPNAPMSLIFTSGTTGFPKAVPFQLQRCWALKGTRVSAIGLKGGPDGDRWYDCMPFYHGTGCNVAVTCLISGITLCVGKKFSTSRFWEDIRDSDATAFVYVGETARYLLAAPPSPMDRQHRVRVMFGNGLRPDVWTKFRDRFGVECISEFFNSTEGVFSLINVNRGDYTAASVGHHGAIQRMLLRNVYVPVKIDHETNCIWRDPKTGFAQRTPYEEGGEIIVAVANKDVFAGYWKSPEATSKKFERDVFKKGDLWFRSGDALRRTSDGRWYFMDRLGDTFRWKSENVSTAEVAEVLGHYPGIVEAIIYGILIPNHDGRAGCAAIYINPAQQSTFDFAAFFAYARQRLPRYAVPVFLRLVGEMSPMHNNKQNKVPLRNEGVELEKIPQSDKIFWWRPGKEKEGYVAFTKADWDRLRGGQVNL